MTTMKGLRAVAAGAVLAAVVVGFTPTATKERRLAAPAAGYAGFAEATSPGWWDDTNGLSSVDSDDKWTYPDMPVECYQDDTAAGGVKASAVRVLWVHADTVESRRDDKVQQARSLVQAAGSVFSASAKRYFHNKATLFSTSLSPRWVTAASTCQITVTDVAVPAVVYNTGPWATSPGGLRDWLVGQGYDEPNRKYLVLLQHQPTYPTGGNPWGVWQPHAENLTGSTGDTRPGLDNAGNYNAFAFVLVQGTLKDNGAPNAKRDSLTLALTVAHELTHTFGALSGAAPNGNPQQPGHPTDCWDIMCQGAGPGETYGVCGGGAQGFNQRPAARLDCGKDDYWAPATSTGTPEAAWTDQWWAVSSSSFLYGNPQPSLDQLAEHPTPAS